MWGEGRKLPWRVAIRMETSTQTSDMLGRIDWFRDELLWTVRECI